MTIDEYLEYIKRYEIPPTPPDVVSANSWMPTVNDEWEEQLKARNVCISYGMWALVADSWVKPLADWIGEKETLEIMAGAGWLAKALEHHNVHITATDDTTWDQRHSLMKPLVAVEKFSAMMAIRTIQAEVLIVSWPPYGEHAVVNACSEWHGQGSIVYIGEGEGGCNAPDEFFKHFLVNDNAPEIDLPQWWGLHDVLIIGNWIM